MPKDDSLRPVTSDRQEPYAAPELVEVGNVVDLTNGSSFEDTADKKRWYY